MQRILILGATGQLGSELMRVCGARAGWNAKGLSHADLEVTDPRALHAVMESFRPQALINCTAYNQVEAAENDPLPAFATNTAAVANLAQACREMDCLLVHFSSDYVFDGKLDRPYREDDPAHPLSIYGLSKLSGEQAVRVLLPRHCILRTCGIYGHARSPGGKLNFVETILGKARRGEPLMVRDDLVCTPTSAWELADAVGQLLEGEAVGTYHATNAGSCTWLEFSQEILRLAGVTRAVDPLQVSSTPRLAGRPRNSVLATEKLASLGVKMSSWRVALADYILRRPS
jgi:dTDP-4-dehydrorhamnose reductase